MKKILISLFLAGFVTFFQPVAHAMDTPPEKMEAPLTKEEKALRDGKLLAIAVDEGNYMTCLAHLMLHQASLRRNPKAIALLIRLATAKGHPEIVELLTSFAAQLS